MSTTVTPKPLARAQLDTSPAVVYEVPGGVTAAVMRSITVTNRMTSSRKPYLYLVPDGATADDSTILLSGPVIPGGGVLQDDAVHVLDAGGQVVGYGDLDGLTVTIDGAEEVVS